MPRAARVRSVDDVTATTSPSPAVRRGISPTAAFLLTIGGHILVVAIAVAAMAAAGAAALVMFGSELLAAL